MKYFVSYTTRDKEITTDLLRQFSKKLEKQGEVFIDLLHNDSIDKQSRVLQELDSSDVMILIETETVYQSEWVVFEIEQANSIPIPIQRIKVNQLDQFTF